MEVSGQPHTVATLSLGKSSWYPLKRRLGKNKFITNSLDLLKTKNVLAVVLVIFREYQY